ncbi:MAG: hypothetical protein EKK51_22815 [Mycolicibacterium sp.]|uniref:Uncharacterized protein n=1 Tax=Mycolicibacterium mucogenicum TaxID=56689 RepID=A0A4R5WMA6_MYCMU|nr:MAG: hypothetical protein EKK51_22815 [Mycolicibacterium sp.]TDK92375.1 hypothetical protein EUA03_04410 [Mycolicibacterium mucogenicum]
MAGEEVVRRLTHRREDTGVLVVGHVLHAGVLGSPAAMDRGQIDGLDGQVVCGLGHRRQPGRVVLQRLLCGFGGVAFPLDAGHVELAVQFGEFRCHSGHFRAEIDHRGPLVAAVDLLGSHLPVHAGITGV